MWSFSDFLSAVLIASTSVSASVVSIPLTKLHVARNGSYLNWSPQVRASFLKARKSGDPVTVPASNLDYVQYTTSVGVGSPATYYNLVVDTGSSNTFVGSVHDSERIFLATLLTDETVSL
jgi:hypothetical protein